MTVTDEGESIGLFEPLLVSGGAKFRPRLNDLARSLAEKSASLSTSLPSALADPLPILIRTIDSYYSNLIEGHLCDPVDIDRALRGEFSDVAGARDLQLEALAHISTQIWIDEDGIGAAPFSVEAIRKIHNRFFEQLPHGLLLLDDGSGGGKLSMEPGAIRTTGVRVGRHVAVSAGAVPRFLARMEQAYKPTGKIESILVAACGHHRLLWVHPFLDGNGRVARLLSATAFTTAIGTKSMWSLSRGLARKEKEYKALLQSCDEPRRGSLDGRGTLSEGALVAFVEYFLTTCIEEVEFMHHLVHPDRLRTRVRTWALEQMRTGRLPPGSDALLEPLISRGQLDRAEVVALINATGGSARQLTAVLIGSGIVQSETPHSPLRLSFPIKLTDQLLPGLFPN